MCVLGTDTLSPLFCKDFSEDSLVIEETLGQEMFLAAIFYSPVGPRKNNFRIPSNQKGPHPFPLLVRGFQTQHL